MGSSSLGADPQNLPQLSFQETAIYKQVTLNIYKKFYYPVTAQWLYQKHLVNIATQDIVR